MFKLLFILSAANAVLTPIAARERLKRDAKDGKLEVQRVTIAVTNETIEALKSKGAYSDLLEAVQRERDLTALGGA